MSKAGRKKKTDKQIWALIDSSIKSTKYVIVRHAKKRQNERRIDDLTLINILDNRDNSKTKRNKSKDKYDERHKNWNYCIEGYDHNDKKIRIIVSFDENYMLIITVIRI